ncbi:MAG: CDP-alcohol phosphatidyltransferase family protein [Patescibacteria group bacterium]
MYEANFRSLAEVPAAWLDKVSRGRITPNTVSALGLIAHIPAFYLIANCYLVYGGLALALAAPTDMLDGALARIQKSGSNFGVVLDAAMDRAKEVLIFSALAYHFASTEQPVYVLLTVLALGISLQISYVKAKGEAAIATTSKKKAADLNRSFSSGLASFPIRVFILVITLLFSVPEVGVIAVIALGVPTIATRVHDVYKSLESSK